MQIGFFAYQVAYFAGGGQFATILPAAIALMTNEARAEEGARELQENDLLSAAAQKKAEDMVARGYFAHQEPTGEMPWHWFTEGGYVYSYAGENLAVNFTDTRQLVDAWLASPTHRDNIVRPEYTDIGIGMATGTYKGREAVFVVQFFGRPREAPLAPPVQKPVAESELAAQQEAPESVVLGVAKAAEEESPAGSWVQKIKVSPRTLNAQILIALGMAFAAVLVLGIFPATRAHPTALLNGFLVFAAITAIFLYQDHFFGAAEVPSESQTASATSTL